MDNIIGREPGEDGFVHDAQRLKELQALPLDRKIQISIARIIEWYNYWNGNVVVSFSGGKDSTVLLHLVRMVFPDVKAVFSDTGLEYPEIRDFVKSISNVDIIKPTENFLKIMTERGYPLISKEVAECCHYARRPYGKTPTENEQSFLDNAAKTKSIPWHLRSTVERESPGRTKQRRKMLLGQVTGTLSKTTTTPNKSIFNKEKWLPLCRDLPVRISHECCGVMKKKPMHDYKRSTGSRMYIGMLAEQSRMRKQGWIRTGCNAFEGANQSSNPMAFWTEQDVLQYIDHFNLPIASVYGDIVRVDKNGQVVAEGCETSCCKLKCTGCQRTGCIYCGFGFHNEGKHGEPTRFQLLAKTHPQLYEYSMRGGKWIDNPDYDPFYDGKPDEMGWIRWNPKKIFVPSGGLGLKTVFDMVNEMYGKDFYKYD